MRIKYDEFYCYARILNYALELGIASNADIFLDSLETVLAKATLSYKDVAVAVYVTVINKSYSPVGIKSYVVGNGDGARLYRDSSPLSRNIVVLGNVSYTACKYYEADTVFRIGNNVLVGLIFRADAVISTKIVLGFCRNEHLVEYVIITVVYPRVTLGINDDGTRIHGKCTAYRRDIVVVADIIVVRVVYLYVSYVEVINRAHIGNAAYRSARIELMSAHKVIH